MTFHEFQTQVFAVLNAVQPDAVQFANTTTEPASPDLEALVTTVRALAETLALSPTLEAALTTFRTHPAGLLATFALVGQLPPEHLMQALNDAFKHAQFVEPIAAGYPAATLLLTICSGIRRAPVVENSLPAS